MMFTGPTNSRALLWEFEGGVSLEWLYFTALCLDLTLWDYAGHLSYCVLFLGCLAGIPKPKAGFPSWSAMTR